ncbi:MAG: glycoside hydrolase family 16 protein [Oscillospiraceae bacterium]|nr:glycoside hydrolase family 16 protein [Oscillospiraceae bacterium]
MAIYEVKNHEPSVLPEGTWRLAWSDEFDGTELDRSKWDYRMSMMGKPWPAWTDKGVHLDGKGNVVFTMLEEDGRIVSSQLQTGYNFMDEPVVYSKFGVSDLQWPIGKLKKSMYLHSHGYFECRCRLQEKEGWRSAFWIQSPIIGASIDPAVSGVEIDVMECFKPGVVVPHNVFTGGYGLDMQREKVGIGAELHDGQFHRFGLLWDETGYEFFIDGQSDGKIETHLSACPEFILISTEVHGYRKDRNNRVHVPEAAENVGDTFLVDYVRVFDKI